MPSAHLKSKAKMIYLNMDSGELTATNIRELQDALTLLGLEFPFVYKSYRERMVSKFGVIPIYANEPCPCCNRVIEPACAQPKNRAEGIERWNDRLMARPIESQNLWNRRSR
jgi:hypothetical protein